jgi:site-specific DNA recombinase
LEGLIVDALKHNLMDSQLVAEFVKEFHAEINRQRRDAELLLDLRRRELLETCCRLDGLIEAIADGFRGTGLQAKLDELERRKAKLESEIDGLPAVAPRLHPNLAELYREKVSNLQDALAEPATQVEALEICGAASSALASKLPKTTPRPSSSAKSLTWCGSPPDRKPLEKNPIGVR